MLSVKGVFSGGGGGSGSIANSIWAETWYPQRGILEVDEEDILWKIVHPDHDLSIDENVIKSTNTVIPLVINTSTFSKINPFVKAVQGYTAASNEVTYYGN